MGILALFYVTTGPLGPKPCNMDIYIYIYALFAWVDSFPSKKIYCRFISCTSTEGFGILRRSLTCPAVAWTFQGPTGFHKGFIRESWLFRFIRIYLAVCRSTGCLSSRGSFFILHPQPQTLNPKPQSLNSKLQASEGFLKLVRLVRTGFWDLPTNPNTPEFRNIP